MEIMCIILQNHKILFVFHDINNFLLKLEIPASESQASVLPKKSDVFIVSDYIWNGVPLCAFEWTNN